MLWRKVGRQEGVHWVEVQSDSVSTKELVEILEVTVQEVKASISDPRFEQIAGEFPTLAPNMPLTKCINDILDSRYGLRPRSLAEIRNALEANNYYFPATTISSLLIALWKRGKIRRWKSGGKFVHHKLVS
ncbi:MAG: hypothetical protein ACREBU_11885 [Nitrososphaera sp.]